ncbi:MAG: mevalonate kinase [Bacteroidetes bacterium]|nr:MAG: mevalonate kinase [Bacteroidota bacterium]
MEKINSYCSKILLFGEYSVIMHSMALSIPYTLFDGKLVIKHITDGSKGIQQSNRELKAFSEYLKLQTQNGELETDFDVLSFDFDIAQGLYFQSNIPQGFGIGSSGALTASLYDRYVYDKIVLKEKPTNGEILKLKKIFGQMESHFHGSSSGVDPLSCYLRKPLLFKSKTKIEIAEIPDFSGKGAVFLLNTSRPRKTEPLVNLFLEKCRSEHFADLCKNQLTVYTDSCIEAFLSNNRNILFENLEKLSIFQFEHFKPMIPTLFLKTWEHGLQSGDYKLKLCGAGGGGFILGFTDNFEKVKNSLQNHQLRVVYRI